jgi:hypothetical protein
MSHVMDHMRIVMLRDEAGLHKWRENHGTAGIRSHPRIQQMIAIVHVGMAVRAESGPLNMVFLWARAPAVPVTAAAQVGMLAPGLGHNDTTDYAASFQAAAAQEALSPEWPATARLTSLVSHAYV